jgi:hypothetical protein
MLQFRLVVLLVPACTYTAQHFASTHCVAQGVQGVLLVSCKLFEQVLLKV